MPSPSMPNTQDRWSLKDRGLARTPPQARCLPICCGPPRAHPRRPARCSRPWRMHRRRASRRSGQRTHIQQRHDGAGHVSVSLTLDQVKERARRAPMVPVFRDLLCAGLSPVTAFAALAGDGPAYLLESVERGQQLGLYSFVAADPMAIVTIAGGPATGQDASGRRELEGADPLRALEAYLQTYAAEPAEGLPEGFGGGAGGYLG